MQLAALDDPVPERDFRGRRAAQTFTRDTVPHTGMVVTIDTGEKHDLHPRLKQPVGERRADHRPSPQPWSFIQAHRHRRIVLKIGAIVMAG
ncbi:MAG: hypothetical protein WEB60_06765 [Terrimicrobiaceae bacterium]